MNERTKQLLESLLVWLKANDVTNLEMVDVMAHCVAAMHEHTDAPVVDIAKEIEIKALEAVNTTQSNEPDPLHRPA